MRATLTRALPSRILQSFGMSINVQRVVCNISTDGLAYEAGVRKGDQVVMFDGKGVSDEDSLFASMRSVPAGQSVIITIARAASDAAQSDDENRR